MASLDPFPGVLGRSNAAHLLRRATFGPTIDQIDQFATLTAADAINLLLDDSAGDPAPPVDPDTKATWVDPTGQPHTTDPEKQEAYYGYFQSWHMDVMRQAALTLKERITWFYHTHLPARWTEIRSSEAIYYQNGLFRHYAYGSFKTLFKKICVDNAMLVYLDGYTNRKNSPNENFAREMLELYSIGKGPQVFDTVYEGDYSNYTEKDIREATKVLTGWMFDDTFSNLDEETGLPTGMIRKHTTGEGEQAVELATEHDAGQKGFTIRFDDKTIQPAEVVDGYATVESAYGELDEMIEMIFAKEETGKFIASKLYRFFVYHFISDEVKINVIEPLAQVLIDNDYSIIEALKVLLSSQHFFDNDDLVKENDNKGALIKSPVDLFTGLFRMFGMQFPDRVSDSSAFYADMGFVVSKLEDQGLNFYEPFEVAGYPAYHQVPGYNRNWITTYALAHRYQAGDILMRSPGEESDLSDHIDIVDWVGNSGHISDPSDPAEIIDVLLENLYSVVLNQERYDFFLYSVFLDDHPDQAYARDIWKEEWELYAGGGTDAGVRVQLERLLSALIQTPEFQLY